MLFKDQSCRITNQANISLVFHLKYKRFFCVLSICWRIVQVWKLFYLRKLLLNLPQAQRPWWSRHGCDLIFFHDSTMCYELIMAFICSKQRGFKLYDRHFTCVLIYVTQNDITFLPEVWVLPLLIGCWWWYCRHKFVCWVSIIRNRFSVYFS